jgi:hypothetical protein
VFHSPLHLNKKDAASTLMRQSGEKNPGGAPNRRARRVSKDTE